MYAKKIPLCHEIGQRIILDYINPNDRPWMEALLNLYEFHVGKTSRDFRFSLREFKKLQKLSHQKFEVIYKILDRLYSSETKQKDPNPRLIRREVFLLAEENRRGPLANFSREKVFQKTAMKLKMSAAEVCRNLFSDLPEETLLSSPKEEIDLELLRFKANLMIVQKFLAQTDTVKIRVLGLSRPVIRHAKWRGLICTIQNKPGDSLVEIDISGPLAIFKKTLIYGKSLGELVPFLCLCKKFQLIASVPYEYGRRTLVIQSGDPIFPKDKLKEFDSKIEENFFKKFSKATTDWDLIREPRPFRSGNKLIFPDFAIQHRTARDCWFLEIIGFWTEDYLKQKILSYSKVEQKNFILCIKESLQCSSEHFPRHEKILTFKTRIDPKAILEIVDQAKEGV